MDEVYLPPRVEPLVMDWGPNGVEALSTTVAVGRHDELARRHIRAAGIRAAVYEATHPRVPAQKLAHLSGVSEGTIRAFADGSRTPQPEVLARIERGLIEALGNDATGVAPSRESVEVRTEEYPRIGADARRGSNGAENLNATSVQSSRGGDAEQTKP